MLCHLFEGEDCKFWQSLVSGESANKFSKNVDTIFVAIKTTDQSKLVLGCRHNDCGTFEMDIIYWPAKKKKSRQQILRIFSKDEYICYYVAYDAYREFLKKENFDTLLA